MKASLKINSFDSYDEAKPLMKDLEDLGVEHTHIESADGRHLVIWSALSSDYQRTSTILAGLRLLQDKLEDGTINDSRKLPHFDDVEPLSPEQIDDLCVELNLS